jgi:hypothetical protein
MVQVFGHRVGCRVLMIQAEHMGDGRNDQEGIAKRSQGDKANSIRKYIEQFGGNLNAQARLANAPSADERHQSYIRTSQQCTYRCYLLLAPYQ